MPPFRNVRPRDAIAAFERAGGIRRGGKGDHVNIKMPNGRIVTIVDTREAVKVSIPHELNQEGGLHHEEFVESAKGRGP